MFTQTELAILKNFSSINTSQVIHPNGFKAINNSKSVIAYYNFDHEPYEFESFGVYDLPEFLSIFNAIGKEGTSMEVLDKHIVLKSQNDQVKYFTSPLNIMPVVPELKDKVETLDFELDFDLTADRIAMIFKMANIIKTDFVFFESAGDKIRITVANELESSNNTYEVSVETGIRSNSLGDSALKIPLSDLVLYQANQGDYSVKMSTKKISKWESLSGIVYYIGCVAV